MIWASSELYYAAHTCCPRCGSSSQSQTYEGCVFYPNREFKDENTRECACGWVGSVDELKPCSSSNS